ncbi:hypothetical protein EV702DRAFT_1247405 [Suillus placidus]|uniref:Uncharacterized protein n=1 Tax=Suillus placidus TaxID=48579 RepID=A0A9P6ZLQ6_9AGAM|nr:hypothetical protein EV702DRAFT_1247405 [Suillus placidus]
MPASKNVFKTNFPLDGGVFERNKFVECELSSNFSKPIQVDLPISHAGAFKYWVKSNLAHRSAIPNSFIRLEATDSTRGSAVLSPQTVYLPFDGLDILTAVSKWMGPWLVHHPEAAHPHPTPTFELDTVILEFSSSIASKGLPLQVRSEADIAVLMTGPAASIKARNMWQYYVLDVEREKEVVKGALNSGKIVPWSGSNIVGKYIVALAEIVKASSAVAGLNELGSCYGIRSDGEMAAGLIQAAL